MNTDKKPQMNTDKKNCGQALIELALFGSFLVFLLGVLLNYGLNYNFNQQAMMEAFRRALGYANQDSTYVYFKDRHIPDPINQFAMGRFVPITASSAVTRNYQLQVTPDPGVYSELPGMRLNMNGTEKEYKTAGWRDEGDIASLDGLTDRDENAVASKDKYEKVYSVVVCKGDDEAICTICSGTGDFETCSDTEYADLSSCEAGCGTTSCDENGNCSFNPGSCRVTQCSANYDCRSNCGGRSQCIDDCDSNYECTYEDGTTCYNTQVMDSCEGNIIGYDSCRKQCMVIVDNRTCTKGPGGGGFTYVSDCACEMECEATTGPETSTDTETYCRNLCAQSMVVPWYCQPGTGGNTFVLDDIVNQTYRYQMGLQPGYDKSIDTTTTFTRDENTNTNYPGAVTTTDDVNWQETINRYVVYNDNICTPQDVLDGKCPVESYTKMSVNRIPEARAATKGDVKQTKWITPW